MKGKELFTPAISCGILDGIVRKYIIENYKVNEGNYTLKDIYESEGVFLTNSLIGVIKVNKIKEKNILKNDIIEYIRKKYLEDIKL